MILRHFDKPRPTGGDALIGWEGEQQVAFYLRRAFENDSAVFVINDLRFLVSEGAQGQPDDYAQIDHLIAYRCGFVLIESKASRNDQAVLHIDARGQWTWRVGSRTYNRPSPLLQVERQSTALRDLLNNSDLPRLKAVVGLVSTGPHKLARHCLVAIGDNMRVEGPGVTNEKRVVKSEAIVEAARTEMQRQIAGTGLLGLMRSDDDAGVVEASHDQLRTICRFLLSCHVPAVVSATPAMPHIPTAPQPAARDTPSVVNPTKLSKFGPVTCNHCNSQNAQVVYRRDYCILCDACGKYSPIDLRCEVCAAQARVRKDGPVFFRDCTACKHQVAFWRASN